MGIIAHRNNMKSTIYNLATKIYDLQLPVFSWLADKVRDITFEPYDY